MICLVTGGAGFIGSHLVEALLARGDTVRVLDNLTTGNRENVPAGAEFFLGDIRQETIVRVLSGVETVFHFAANPSVKASVEDPMEAHSVIAGGTLNMLLASRAASAKRFVLASSCAVYGDNEDAKEIHMVRPISPYGAAKVAAEMYCRTFIGSFMTICLRFFNVWGESQTGPSIIPAIRLSKESGEPVSIYGLANTRDFVHVNDAVKATITATQAGEMTVNVGSGYAISIAELVEMANATCKTNPSMACDPWRCVANRAGTSVEDSYDRLQDYLSSL